MSPHAGPFYDVYRDGTLVRMAPSSASVAVSDYQRYEQADEDYTLTVYQVDADGNRLSRLTDEEIEQLKDEFGMKSIHALVSYPDHFEICKINPGLNDLQKLVGGYIEAVIDSDSGWSLYCNEEGKLKGLKVNVPSTAFIDKLYRLAGRPPFSQHDILVGPVVWLGPTDELGNETSLPIDYMGRFSDSTLQIAELTKSITERTKSITVIRVDLDVWVYDQIDERVSTKVVGLARTESDKTIEVWTGLDPARWTELRGELTSYDATLHDERNDRSYG